MKKEKDIFGEEYLWKTLLDVANFRPVILGHSAWIQHTPFAYWLIKVFKPNVFVELGTHYGVSYFAFCQSVKDNDLETKCNAVDTWKGDAHAGLYGNEVFKIVNEHNSNHYGTFSKLYRMTFDEALSYFEDKSVDLLHIDGFHTYEAVKHDFESWLPKLAPGAIVLFHDTTVKERDFGVWKFWEELKREYSLNFEFYHGYGLGVLQISESKQSYFLEFLVKNAQHIRNYFSNLGLLIEKSEYELLNNLKTLNQVRSELFRLKKKLEEKRDEKISLHLKLSQLKKEKADLQKKLKQGM